MGMEQNERKWYTPEEIRQIVFDGLVCISTVRNMCLRGDIPCIRIGGRTDVEGKPVRRRLLVPASYVKEMQDKSGGMYHEAQA